LQQPMRIRTGGFCKTAADSCQGCLPGGAEEERHQSPGNKSCQDSCYPATPHHLAEGAAVSGLLDIRGRLLASNDIWHPDVIWIGALTHLFPTAGNAHDSGDS